MKNMNKTLVVGVVAIILIGILAVFLGVGKHPVTNITTTTNTTVNITTTTKTTTTNTTTTNTTTVTNTTTTKTSNTTVTNTTATSKLQPESLYLLNYTNGTYWFMAVFNVTFPSKPVEVSFDILYGNPIKALPVYQYQNGGYTELVFPLTPAMENELVNNTLDGKVLTSVVLINGVVENYQLTYAGTF